MEFRVTFRKNIIPGFDGGFIGIAGKLVEITPYIIDKEGLLTPPLNKIQTLLEAGSGNEIALDDLQAAIEKAVGNTIRDNSKVLL